MVVVVIDTARHTLFREGSFPLLSARAAAAETVENMTGTAGWTGPAVTSMMTGFRVEERQARGGVEALSDAEVETLAETLQGHGWHTYLNSANLVLTTSLNQGFDEQVFSDKTAETTAARLSAVHALLEAHDEPVFAWVQLMELHIPFGPMADSCEAEVTAAAALCPVELYDIGDAVNYGHIDFEALAAEEQLACGEAIHSGQSCAATRLDVELDAFLSALPPATLVLVTTDHGEGWLDPSADHNWTLNQKISSSFLALFDAAHEPTSYALASQVDLPPTVLSRLGLQGPTEQYEGVALGEARTTPLTAWRCDTNTGAVESALWEGDYQALRLDRRRGHTGYSLYHTAEDPDGDVDLAETGEIPPDMLITLDETFDRTQALCAEGSGW